MSCVGWLTITCAKAGPPVLPVKNVNGLEVVGSMPAFAAVLTWVTTLTTVTLDTPTALMSAAVIVVCSCVLETKVVALGLPLKFTTEEGTKFVPVTVTVKSPPPCTAEPGVRSVILGGGKAAVNVNLPEVPPAGVGLNTVTEESPTLLMSAEGIDACNVVEETKVVGRAAPANWTTEVGTKFVPVTVRVKAGPPAARADGLKLETVGSGLLTVRGKPAETPPCPAGFATVTVLLAPAATSAAVIDP